MSVNVEYWSIIFTTGCPSCGQPHVWDEASNSSKYNILAGTQIIQLYKFVCTILTPNSNINLRCKTALQSHLTTYLGKSSDAILGPHHKDICDYNAQCGIML